MFEFMNGIEANFTEYIKAINSIRYVVPSFIYDYVLVVSFIFGAILGSFSSSLTYRLTRGVSLTNPKFSYCPHCKTTIKFYHNIPIISYLILKGKCAYCKKNLSWSYFGLELTFALLTLELTAKSIDFHILWQNSDSSETIISTVTIYGLYDILSQFVIGLLFIFFVINSVFSDLETFIEGYFKKNELFKTGIVPNEYTIIGTIIGLLSSPFSAIGFTSSLFGMLTMLILFLVPVYIYSKLRDYDLLRMMGGADFKFAALLGAFLGLESTLAILLISTVLGSIIGLIIIAITKDRRLPLPFVPFLGVAGLIYYFFSNTLYTLYFSLFT